jgi:hypothetical protein
VDVFTGALVVAVVAVVAVVVELPQDGNTMANTNKHVRISHINRFFMYPSKCILLCILNNLQYIKRCCTCQCKHIKRESRFGQVFTTRQFPTE